MDEIRRFKSLKFDLRTCRKENFGDVTRQKKFKFRGKSERWTGWRTQITFMRKKDWRGKQRRQSYKIICYGGNQLPTKIQGTVVEGRG